MQKKLLAVAVAGALAVPGVALAQSSVTISGFFKGGLESVKISSGAALANSSSTSVVDDSSRIIFNVREDLGGGLSAIGQFDMRMSIDMGSLSGTGNNHVGLQSKQWGRLTFGRQDLHYFNRESDMTARGTLRSDSISILAFAGAGRTAIAGATRTANVVQWISPNWGGFTLGAAYSSNAAAADLDIGTGGRKGSAWNLNPNFAGKNFQVGYSYWRSKEDATAATAAGFAFDTTTGAATAVAAAGVSGVEQRGDRLYGSYNWGGLKVGLAWDKSKLKTIAGATTSDRTAWSLPVSYSWGKHSVHAHYDKARDDKATAGVSDGAKMFALSYAYDLSKRTSASVTYAKINNDAAGRYNLFTGVGLGGQQVATAAGQDPRVIAFTMRHAF